MSQKVSSLFSGNKLDEEFLQALSRLLLTADTGVQTTNTIIKKLSDDVHNASITTLEQAKDELKKQLVGVLQKPVVGEVIPKIVLLAGVNGSGKTTFISKYVHLLKQQGKKVLVVAGDTFRAAATQQLHEWADRVGVAIFIGKEQQDPASVVFDACEVFKKGGYDNLVIDTAGRLQTKVNLMRELEKIKRIIEKQLPGESINTWLTIDAMLGQNGMTQAQVFYEATKVNAIILTKLDGTGKGGIVFAICSALNLPILYVTYGEGLEDIKRFDANEYVDGLLNV